MCKWIKVMVKITKPTYGEHDPSTQAVGRLLVRLNDSPGEPRIARLHHAQCRKFTNHAVFFSLKLPVHKLDKLCNAISTFSRTHEIWKDVVLLVHSKVTLGTPAVVFQTLTYTAEAMHSTANSHQSTDKILLYAPWYTQAVHTHVTLSSSSTIIWHQSRGQ